MQKCSVTSYAVGDMNGRLDSNGDVLEFWYSRKPFDVAENAHAYILRVHQLTHLQPEDMREKKKQFRTARGKGEDPWPHVGSHPFSVQRLVSEPFNRQFVKDALSRVISWLLECYSGERRTNLFLLFVCNWGKHRSWAMAWLTWCLFDLALCKESMLPTSLNVSDFAKFSCGRTNCHECDSGTNHNDKRGVVYYFWDRFAPALCQRAESRN